MQSTTGFSPMVRTSQPQQAHRPKPQRLQRRTPCSSSTFRIRPCCLGINTRPRLQSFPMGLPKPMASRSGRLRAMLLSPDPLAAITVSISPPSAPVQVGLSQQFTGAVRNDPANQGVAWRIGDGTCPATNCGTIDSTGKYTARMIVPNPPTITVSATSVADSSKSGSAAVILGSNPNNAKLNGRYAFLLQGYDGDGSAAFAGSFMADGNGNITAGIADFNFSSAIFVATNLTFAGIYSVGSDNRGSMTLTLANAGAALSGFTQTLSFALDSFASGVAGRGRLVEID